MNKQAVIMQEPRYNSVVIECENKAYTPFRIFGMDEDKSEACIYEQDELTPRRVCWLGEYNYAQLFIEWEGENAVTARAVHIEQKKPFRINEYIILCEDLLKKPLFISEKTTDLIVIGLFRYNEKEGAYLTDEDLFKRCVRYIKESLKGRSVRLWSCLCIGQADANFATETVRKQLVQNLLDHLEKYDFDGLDIDYEYPGTDADWREFSDLLVEIRTAFTPANRLLSCALAPWGCNFTEEAVKALDYVNAMIYDLFDEVGCHESFQEFADAIEFFRKKGYADEAICAGIGFYGRPADKSAVWRDYGYFYGKYGEALNPNSNLLEDVWFNGRTMCMDKMALALMEGIGGIMIWHHTSDIDFEHPFSLLRGCCQVIDGVKSE